VSGLALAKRTVRSILNRIQGVKPVVQGGWMTRLTFPSPKPDDIRKDIQEKYGLGEFGELFCSNQGTLVHKWHHYIPLYERYFSAYRGKNIRLLEIGVSEGGSLQMWREYFGDKATIFGIDINPNCAQFNGQSGQVRIGSQDDEPFLLSVVKEMGGVDVVIDDGSHIMEHVTASLKFLFPHVSDGGLYMIEDLHTAYWENYGGGYGVDSNFYRHVLQIVDDMHHWYHTHGQTFPVVSQSCPGIHIHDSIVVLEKNKVHQPAHSKVGVVAGS
jgi:hypothetical protein